MPEYVQRYDDISGDAVCNPLPTGRVWWHCEHDDDSHTVMSADVGGKITCEDCATVYVVWRYRGDVLAKAVVVYSDDKAEHG